MDRVRLVAPIMLMMCVAALPVRAATGQDDPVTDANRIDRLIRDASGARADRAEKARAQLADLPLAAVTDLARHLENASTRRLAVTTIEETVGRALSRLARVGPDAIEEEERARLEEGFARVGPLAASGLVHVWVRGRGATKEAAQRIWTTLAAEAPEDDAAWGRIEAALPLSAPLLGAYAADTDPSDRAEAIARRMSAAAISSLSSDDFGEREEAAWLLGRLGPLAEPAMRDSLPDADAHRRHELDRILRQVEYRMSPELVRLLGNRLEGFEQLDWRGRRAVIYRMERLGRQEAVPTLRRILSVERSLAVRVSAAEALARLGDKSGLPLLELAGLAERYNIPQVTIGIYHDQGIRYLRRGEYQRAAGEFRKILEIDAKHSNAHYNLACAYSLMGDTDKALEHLRLSMEYGFDDVKHMEEDEDLDPIREDPRYGQLIDEHGGAE